MGCLHLLCVRLESAARLVGQVAQLVEQWTENPCVAGSIPALPIRNKLRRNAGFFVLMRTLAYGCLVGEQFSRSTACI